MKKLYILSIAALLAVGVVSCGKEDDKTTTTPTPTNPNTNTIDVWAKGMGTYKGTITPSGMDPAVEDQRIVVTKISDTKIQVAPGPGNSYTFPSRQIDITKGDSTIRHQQGAFSGTIDIYVRSSAAIASQLVYSDNDKGFSFFGEKQ